MSVFLLNLEQVAPLQIQLGTPSSCGVEVRGWSVWAETAVGSTSRPVFYRPSIPGTSRKSGESAPVVCLNQPGRVTQVEVLNAFSTNPSYPDVVPVRTNFPYRITVDFPRGKGIIIPPNDYGVLYAKTDFTGADPQKGASALPPSGFRWNASIIYEEL